jgi:hypothetical protein
MAFYGMRFRGYGALPAFEIPGGGLAAGLVNNFLDQVPASSPNGMNSRQLIARARELELLYGDLMKLPQGAEVVAAARGLELNLAQAWADIVGFATEVDRTLATDPAFRLALLRQRPGADYTPIKFMPPWSPTYTPAMKEWDTAHDQILKDMADHRAKLDSLTAKVKASLANSLGPKLVTYVVSVSNVANRIRELEHAIVEEKTAISTGNRAAADLAKQKVQVEQRKVEKAAAKLEGPSPLVIAAVAIPVLGAIAYALSRKKGSSVGGYRRRRSRR